MRNDIYNRGFRRSAGILMPISSLPSPYGIGTFGEAAYKFVDFIEASNHRYWQVLPLGPTSYGDSPYQTLCVFAGNPYFIDLDVLVEEGLLNQSYIQMFSSVENDRYVAYEMIFKSRFIILNKAFENFKEKLVDENDLVYDKFIFDNREWLEDYALFMACKEHFEYISWGDWEDEIKFRRPNALEKYKVMLKDKIDFWYFCQYQFSKQWNKLKQYANDRGIEIIGDVPIYTSLDSSDVWANTSSFLLDDNLNPTKVAGVPPDTFTSLGQKWGNPIYDWDSMEKDGFKWWYARMEKSAELYDVIRIDHFIGIAKYYSIPTESDDATNGQYHIGPGKKLTDVINSAVGNKKIVAENLGVSIPEADQLLLDNHYADMRVIEFAFDGNCNNPHLPFNFNRNSVVYGGTHDNETLQGFFDARSDEELENAFAYLGTRDKRKMVNEVFRSAYSSVANLVIFQVQDILKLDNTARMNFPSTIGANWNWRLINEELEEQHSCYLKNLVKTFGR